MDNLQKIKQDWYNENAPFGRELGYPECCIKEFCEQPPVTLQGRKPTTDEKIRYQAAHMGNVWTGFIPCINHARQIVAGKITLISLIQNRNPAYPPFPAY